MPPFLPPSLTRPPTCPHPCSDDEGEGEGGQQQRRPGASAAAQAQRWVQQLLTRDYDCLCLRDRLAALLWLTEQVLEGPSLRAELEDREREVANARKQLWEDAKVCCVGGAGCWGW